MKRLFLLSMLTLAAFTANATVRYVSMLGNDNNNGLAWSTAKRNIDGAMNDAAQGDTVFVAIGTYPKFSAKNGVHVFGGFLGTEQSLSERQALHHGYLQDSSCTRIFTASQSEQFLTTYYSCIDYEESATVPTVIDGLVVKVDSVYNTYAILILALLDGDYHLSNCTLDGEYAEVNAVYGWSYMEKASYGYSTTASGSGFYVYDCAIRHCFRGGLLSHGSHTNNCIFEYNDRPIESRQLNGYTPYGLITIEDCLFQNNRREVGHVNSGYDLGLLLLYSNVDMKRCIIRNNEVVILNDNNIQSAAIIACSHRCRITDCLLANNSIRASRTRPNIIYLHQGYNILQNNTIANNLLWDSASHVPSRLLRTDGSINLYNNLFWGNTGHSQFFHGFNSSIDNVMFNAMQDTLLGQTGNFRLDQDSIGPLFVGPTTFAGARFDADSMQQVLTADWHLSSGSSCVNAGHPYHVSLPYQSTTDLDGLNRVSGGHIDIGCYEFPEADAEQHIVWGQSLDAYRSAGQLSLTATATSGLPVSYSSSNSNVATVHGDTLLFVASGRCTITATQSGDSIWLPAPSISRTLTVYGDTVMVHDTVWATDTLTVYDTVTVQVFDTIPLYDTIVVFDTVTIYDTVQVSIEKVDDHSQPWTVTVEDEYIAVCGAEGETIRIFDALGRQLHIQPAASEAVRFRMPSSGVYLIKVGSSPAKKVTIIR